VPACIIIEAEVLRWLKPGRLIAKKTRGSRFRKPLVLAGLNPIGFWRKKVQHL
jgi:hypothetical protein